MNRPSRPLPPSSPVSPPYERDGYGWAMSQVGLIRARRFGDLDIENIAEELESVGRSEKSSGESALRILMAHILKWRHQPRRRGRSWAITIATQRTAFEQVLDDNPSLKPKLDDMRERAFKLARLDAAKEMDVSLKTIPNEMLDWKTILTESFEHDPA